MSTALLLSCCCGGCFYIFKLCPGQEGEPIIDVPCSVFASQFEFGQKPPVGSVYLINALCYQFTGESEVNPSFPVYSRVGEQFADCLACVGRPVCYRRATWCTCNGGTPPFFNVYVPCDITDCVFQALGDCWEVTPASPTIDFTPNPPDVIVEDPVCAFASCAACCPPPGNCQFNCSVAACNPPYTLTVPSLTIICSGSSCHAPSVSGQYTLPCTGNCLACPGQFVECNTAAGFMQVISLTPSLGCPNLPGLIPECLAIGQHNWYVVYDAGGSLNQIVGCEFALYFKGPRGPCPRGTYTLECMDGECTGGCQLIIGGPVTIA